MKRKRWVKIKTEHPNVWYLLSSEGDWIKRTVHYRDARGVVRGKNAKNRKVKKCIDTFYPSRNLNKKSNKIEVKFDAGVHKSKSKRLANMVLYYFGDKEPPCYNASLRYKDGDPNNCSINNLEWLPQKRDGIEYNMMAYRYYKKHIYNGVIRYYRVPDTHPLYSQYQEYLDNQNVTHKLLKKFTKDHRIRCRLIRVGYKQIRQKVALYEMGTVNRPYFEFTDEDEKRIKHDIKWLKTAVAKRPVDGYYHLVYNSHVMKDWIKLLNKKKHKLIEIPDVRPYTDNENGKLLKSFAFYKGDLYLKIESDREFTVDKELVRVKGIKFE